MLDKNDEFCIENDEFCIKVAGSTAPTNRSWCPCLLRGMHCCEFLLQWPPNHIPHFQHPRANRHRECPDTYPAADYYAKPAVLRYIRTDLSVGELLFSIENYRKSGHFNRNSHCDAQHWPICHNHFGSILGLLCDTCISAGAGTTCFVQATTFGHTGIPSWRSE